MGGAMNYPDELDADDIQELVAYIERAYPTEEIRVHDAETMHFGYWDTSHRIISAMLLDHIQAAGYCIIHAGIATVPRRVTRRAWMECRKHDPLEDDAGELDEDEKEDKNESDAITLLCEYCGQKFTPDEARGPGEVRYTCHRCGHGTDGPSPINSDFRNSRNSKNSRNE
jgi:hypothetical protein